MSLVAVGVFQFTEATVRVSESSSEAEITIENTGDSSVPARLRLSPKDLSATSGKDFLLLDEPAIVRFSPGDTLQTYRVTIVNDNERETDESFELEMSFSGPASPAVTLGSPSVVTVIIEDDDTATEPPTTRPLRAGRWTKQEKRKSNIMGIYENISYITSHHGNTHLKSCFFIVYCSTNHL